MKKILFVEELLKKLKSLRASGKSVVYTMGVFDIVHPGIIDHLNEARSQGDILVVGVIRDKDVRRGPGRPVFSEQKRAENVAALESVDYVCLVDNDIPFESVGIIKPEVFAKGQAYRERDEKIHGMLSERIRELNQDKTRIHETTGMSFSSSELIKNMLEIYPPETRTYLEKFKKRYSFDRTMKELDRLKNLRVLLIGDGIIDEYHYVKTMNKSAKSPIVVNKYIEHEVFAGGAFIIANHVAGICADVQLVTLMGTEDSREEFVRDTLKPNIEPVFFVRKDSTSIIKKRYINQYLNQKLFEVNYLDEEYISGELEQKVIRHLKKVIPDYDLVLVSDFGHGLITEKVRKTIEKLAPVRAINTQTNGANAGYNLITKYRSPLYVCLDEAEVRLAAQDRFTYIEDLAVSMNQKLKARNLIVTLGKRGSFGITSEGKKHRTPIFSSKVVDTVGAGDAFFAFTSPCVQAGMPIDLVSFIGNAVGALAVEIMGNKKPVEKYELLEFISSILK